MFKSINNLGFGFVELGTVLKHPQAGNKPPRIFKDEKNNSIINRMGLNSKGLDYFMNNIKTRRNDQIIGVNVGTNNNSKSPIKDYLDVLEKTDSFSDYTVVNISCPNTQDFDKFKNISYIDEILLNIKTISTKPVLIKISPDINDYLLQRIIDISLDHQIDGVIVSNTQKTEKGGISGKGIQNISTDLIKKVYKYSHGKLLIIGCGGIFSGKDAYEKIKNGASLVQIYTSFIYNGPKIVYNINEELEKLLIKDGYTNISQCVGVNVDLTPSYQEYVYNSLNYYINYLKFIF